VGRINISRSLYVVTGKWSIFRKANGITEVTVDFRGSLYVSFCSINKTKLKNNLTYHMTDSQFSFYILKQSEVFMFHFKLVYRRGIDHTGGAEVHVRV